MNSAAAFDDDGSVHVGQEEAGEAVLREHVDGLFRQPFVVLPGGDLIAAGAAGFAAFASGRAELFILSLLMAGAGFLRLSLQRAFRRLPVTDRDIVSLREWHLRYVFFSWIAAAFIGAFGWLAAQGGAPGIRILGACVVFAATATMVRTGTFPRFVIAQVALAFLPMLIVWSRTGETSVHGLVGFSLVYFLLLARIATGAHALTFGALTSAERNRALAGGLEQKNAQLERQEAQLRAQALRFDAALENMAQGLAMYDGDLRLLVCNSRYLQHYRFDPNVVQPGITLRQVVDHYASIYSYGGLSSDEFYQRQLRWLTGEEALVYSRQLGDGRMIEVNYRPMPGGGYVVTTEDVTEQRQTETRLAHLASHDPLTDLVNRYELPRRLLDALTSPNGNIAIFALGLDRFKTVNDTHGHPVGDALLQAVASRLRKLAGEHGTVARLGGDEFVCLVSGLHSRDAIDRLGARMSGALSVPYDIEGKSIEISASIGIAVAPADGEDPEALLRNADVALRRTKAEGRGAHMFFGADMERLLRERRELEADIRSGMQNGEFTLHYQPIIEVATRQVIGCEALLRWQHPQRGLLMPGEFICIAEETGLITQIGEWVLRTACQDAASWPVRLKVAVNVSPLQFGGAALLNSVVSALAQSGLPASRLELEITEAVLLRDTEDTLATLRKLRRLGVRIVMDDFGTGYSSLSYLRIFPFDKIKIDRSFVGGCKSRTESLAIIQAVADLAHGLGMTTTAEGIETEEQMKLVRERGCTEAQGYLFGRPMPLSDLHAHIAPSPKARRAA